MTLTVIITICVLLLIAYLFDLTSSLTKIPSVLLLLLLGWIVRQLTGFLGIQLPNLSSILPILGTIGLILIVMDGSLALELNTSKIKLINKSVWGALIPMFILAFSLAYFFNDLGYYTIKEGLINAIPLCVISSAIAIPTVRNLPLADREFITYESSLSDIFGVIFFNFLIRNETINSQTFATFGLEILSIIVISFITTVSLSFLLHKIEHHIKFIPIILLVFLIYAISKMYHLPALIFILIFGLFLGNINKLRRFKWIKRFRLKELNREVNKFKDITVEATFLIRALFFLLFGYLIETPEILNYQTFIWAIIIVIGIIIIRAVQLLISRLPLLPLLFIAPRGLITILLFLSIDEKYYVHFVNKSLIIQVILLSALIMMIGLMLTKKRKELAPENEENTTTLNPVSKSTREVT